MVKIGGRSCILGLTLAVVMAACGNTHDDTQLSTGISPGKQLRDLEPAEATQFCRSVRDFASHQGSDALCRFAGVVLVSVQVRIFPPATDADARKQCADTEASCHDSIAMGKDPNLCRLPSAQATCAATVAEYEACFNENFAAAQRTIPQCSELELGNVPTMVQNPASVSAGSGPACAKLLAHCPDLPSETSGPTTMDGGAM